MVSTTNLKSFLTSQTQERGARAELRELHYGSKDGVPLAEEIKRDNLDVVEGPEMQIEFLKRQIRDNGHAASLDEQAESPRFGDVPRAVVSE